MESEKYDYYQNYGSVRSEVYDWVEAAVFAVVCMVIIFTFIARTVSVDGMSMADTLQHGDRLINSRFLYTPAYADIVVITQPNKRGEPLIKRIIATEGQEVDIDFFEGIVKINGQVLDEPYIKELTQDSGEGVTYPIVVPKGHVFVMGDNRNASWDSRVAAVGMIDTRYILGRTIYRVSPWETHGDPDDYWKE